MIRTRVSSLRSRVVTLGPSIGLGLELELAPADSISSLRPYLSSLGPSTYTVLGLALELDLPFSHRISVLRPRVSSLT